MGNLEQKYQILSEVDHILTRPGMYIGSNDNITSEQNLFKPSDNKIVRVDNVLYNAGLIKLIDEVLSNSIDESRRGDKALFPITEISVHLSKDGTVIIEDNGGIPVQKHKQAGIWIPQLIFGQLRTSSNYDDTEDRQVIGTNGVGSKIANIFSSYFRCITSDGKNEIDIKWINNMKDIEFCDVKPTKTHKTRIEFKIELERFMLEEIPLSIARIIQKRCIDGAAANPGLKIKYTTDINDLLNSDWIFDNFMDYVKLYLSAEQQKEMIQYDGGKDKIVLIPNIGFDVAFINGALCPKGSHIIKVQEQVIEKLLGILKDNEIELITKKDIINKISLFVITNVSNPKYDSQTKETLVSKIDRTTLNLSKQFLKELETSEIVNILIDFYKTKYAAEEKKKLRKLNASIKATKTKKLITCSSRTSEENELWLFEGTSASAGFREYRNPMTQSAYLLRGKVKNTFSLTREKILENVELREIIATLGLVFGDPKGNVKNCRFRKIIFGTDADQDGQHIAGLLIAFFSIHFPELFKSGYIYRSLSPIVILYLKNGEKKYFYTDAEFETYCKTNNTKGLEVDHCKGLGSLIAEDYEDMLLNKKLIQFTLQDASDIEAVKVWFSKQADQRKEMLMIDSEENE